MPPQFIKPETTDPMRRLPETIEHSSDRPRGRLSRLLGGRGLEVVKPEKSRRDLHMNIAETYGVSWSLEKCARDALQNFFDANGGTLDGVDILQEKRDSEDSDMSLHDVIIRGGGSYDYRDLTILGATSKKTGETTAGGFGEGAKVLSLVLLRDHEVERVVYRSNDWQLDFFLDDLPRDTAARPTRGLFARVATGLDKINGSEMMISCKDPGIANEIVNAKQLFNSSENPDFQNVTIEKKLLDGSSVGIKLLGVTQGRREKLEKGNLYIAGQRREYDRYGDESGWETMEGVTVFTSKDIAAGDRDRGGISKKILEDELLKPIANQMDDNEVKEFLKSLEPNYSTALLEFSELDAFLRHVLRRGRELGVSMEFDKKYVACHPSISPDTKQMLREQGLVLCDNNFRYVGMRTSNEAVRAIHEHQRVEPSAEHEKKIVILHRALEVLNRTSAEKYFEPKEVALYSQSEENNPAHGTHSEEYVWLAVEYLDRGFAQVFATYLHELDHKHGSDQSSEFSYALTDTLSAVLNVVSTDSETSSKWGNLAAQWSEIKAD